MIKSERRIVFRSELEQIWFLSLHSMSLTISPKLNIKIFFNVVHLSFLQTPSAHIRADQVSVILAATLKQVDKFWSNLIEHNLVDHLNAHSEIVSFSKDEIFAESKSSKRVSFPGQMNLGALLVFLLMHVRIVGHLKWLDIIIWVRILMSQVIVKLPVSVIWAESPD